MISLLILAIAALGRRPLTGGVVLGALAAEGLWILAKPSESR